MSLDPQAVQRALVCMLFDPRYAARVRGSDPLPELRAGERELLRELDPRALGTDEMRRSRAVHALIDEYPVSAAVIGLDAVDRFFGSQAFRDCVFRRGSMALAFGQRYLRDRAKGIGVIETATARARRATPGIPGVGASSGARAGASNGASGLVCRPGLVPIVAPTGSLTWYQSARAKLGPSPLAALARRRKPWPQKPPRRGREHLLVEVQADGSVSLGGGSAALVALLLAAGSPRPRAELAAAAIELGAEAAEVEELLDGLLDEGLLASADLR